MLTTNAQTSQTEIKNLSAKLSAARAQSESAITSSKTAGGAANGVNVRANANAGSKGDEAYILKLKEDLYSDLTGLMIHNVKRLQGEDVFDCLQTGRNGSEFLRDIFPRW
jgi:hypothetical protein